MLFLIAGSVVAMAPSAGASRDTRLSLTPGARIEADGTLRLHGKAPPRRRVTIQERVDMRWTRVAARRADHQGRFTALVRPRTTGETLLRARSGDVTSRPKRAPGRPPPEPLAEGQPPPPSAPIDVGPSPEPTPAVVLTGFSNGATVDRQLPADESARLLGEAGADVDRVQINWAQLEPSPGDFRFGIYDAIYAADLARGIRPLFNFAYAPSWANGGVCPDVGNCHAPPTPAHYDDAARVAAMIAARYPKAAGIEIWNEPNGAYFWRPKPDPDAYAALLIACSAAIKRVNATIKVVGPATASGPGSLATGKISSADFLGALYLSGAGRALDVISVHAYPDAANPTGSSAAAELDGVRLARDWFGDPSTPIWITETGVTTSGPLAVSEAQQASKLAELDRVLGRAADVGMVLFHTLIEPNHDPAGPDPGYGVVTAGLRRKPAFCSLAVAWGRDASC